MKNFHSIKLELLQVSKSQLRILESMYNSSLGSSIKHRIKALSFYCLPSLRLLCWFFPFNFNSDCIRANERRIHLQISSVRVSKAYQTKKGLCYAGSFSRPRENSQIFPSPLIGLRYTAQVIFFYLPRSTSAASLKRIPTTTCYRVIVLRESPHSLFKRHTLDWENSLV